MDAGRIAARLPHLFQQIISPSFKKECRILVEISKNFPLIQRNFPNRRRKIVNARLSHVTEAVACCSSRIWWLAIILQAATLPPTNLISRIHIH